MRLIIILLIALPTSSIFSQVTEEISNSFEIEYRKSNPTLAYSFDNISKTHNYSNNWDFDNDGIKDQLFFVGTGGAHLYYFLKVILSSEKLSREFDFIESDFPFLTSTDTLNIDKTSVGFVVATFGNNQTSSIIVRLDNSSYYSHEKMFLKMGIKTKRLVVSFESGKVKYGCL